MSAAPSRRPAAARLLEHGRRDESPPLGDDAREGERIAMRPCRSMITGRSCSSTPLNSPSGRMPCVVRRLGEPPKPPTSSDSGMLRGASMNSAARRGGGVSAIRRLPSSKSYIVTAARGPAPPRRSFGASSPAPLTIICGASGRGVGGLREPSDTLGILRASSQTRIAGSGRRARVVDRVYRARARARSAMHGALCSSKNCAGCSALRRAGAASRSARRVAPRFFAVGGTRRLGGRRRGDEDARAATRVERAPRAPPRCAARSTRPRCVGRPPSIPGPPRSAGRRRRQGRRLGAPDVVRGGDARRQDPPPDGAAPPACARSPSRASRRRAARAGRGACARRRRLGAALDAAALTHLHEPSGASGARATAPPAARATTVACSTPPPPPPRRPRCRAAGARSPRRRGGAARRARAPPPPLSAAARAAAAAALDALARAAAARRGRRRRDRRRRPRRLGRGLEGGCARTRRAAAFAALPRCRRGDRAHAAPRAGGPPASVAGARRTRGDPAPSAPRTASSAVALRRWRRRRRTRHPAAPSALWRRAAPRRVVAAARGGRRIGRLVGVGSPACAARAALGRALWALAARGVRRRAARGSRELSTQITRMGGAADARARTGALLAHKCLRRALRPPRARGLASPRRRGRERAARRAARRRRPPSAAGAAAAARGGGERAFGIAHTLHLRLHLRTWLTSPPRAGEGRGRRRLRRGRPSRLRRWRRGGDAAAYRTAATEAAVAERSASGVRSAPPPRWAGGRRRPRAPRGARGGGGEGGAPRCRPRALAPPAPNGSRRRAVRRRRRAPWAAPRARVDAGQGAARRGWRGGVC